MNPNIKKKRAHNVMYDKHVWYQQMKVWKQYLSQKALKFEIRPGTSRNHFPMVTITLYTGVQLQYFWRVAMESIEVKSLSVWTKQLEFSSLDSS